MITTTVPDGPLRPVAQDEIDALDRDGVVCLSQIVPQFWANELRLAFDEIFGKSSTTPSSEIWHDDLANWDGDLAAPRCVKTAELDERELLRDPVTDEAARGERPLEDLDRHDGALAPDARDRHSVTADRGRRAASRRDAGDDVVYWEVPGAPPMPHWAREHANGDPLHPEQFPVVWPQ